MVTQEWLHNSQPYSPHSAEYKRTAEAAISTGHEASFIDAEYWPEDERFGKVCKMSFRPADGGLEERMEHIKYGAVIYDSGWH